MPLADGYARETPQAEAVLAPTHRATSSARYANSTYEITVTINYAHARRHKRQS